MEINAERAHVLLHGRGCGLTQLPRQKPAVPLQHGHAGRLVDQGTGRFKAQKPPADHHHARVRLDLGQDIFGILPGPQYGHIFPVRAGHRLHKGMRAHGQNQFVVGQVLAAPQAQAVLVRIHCTELGAQLELNRLLFIPAFSMKGQMLGADFTGQVACQIQSIIG